MDNGKSNNNTTSADSSGEDDSDDDDEPKDTHDEVSTISFHLLPLFFFGNLDNLFIFTFKIRYV